MGEFLRGQDPAAVAQHHVTAVIVFDEPGLHVLAAEIGDGVQMGDKAHAGLVLKAGAGGDEAVDIGVLVLINALHAQFAHLLCQQVGQIELAGGGRRLLRVLRAGGVYLDVG